MTDIFTAQNLSLYLTSLQDMMLFTVAATATLYTVFLLGTDNRRSTACSTKNVTGKNHQASRI